MSGGKRANASSAGCGHLEYFLAGQQGKSVQVTYDVVDTYIEFAGGRQVIETLVNAVTDTAAYRTWRTKDGARLSANDRQKLDAVVQSLMVDCSPK